MSLSVTLPVNELRANGSNPLKWVDCVESTLVDFALLARAFATGGHECSLTELIAKRYG